MKVPSEALGPTLLGITTGVSIFNAFLPDIADVRKTDPHSDPERAADVRMGELGGSIVVLGIGVVASYIAETPAPALVSLTVAVGMVFLYEWTLAGRRFSALEG